MRLISWNLNNNEDLLRRALSFVAGHSSAIGAFQEVPSRLTQESLASSGFGSRLMIHHQMVSPLYRRNLAIVSTSGIRSAGRREDPEKKFAAVTMSLPDFGLVDVVVIHAISKATETNERERFKRAASLRKNLETIWHCPKLIALGDFNAEPFDAEIWDTQAFNAVRDRRLVRLRHDDDDHRRRPLINLSWNWLSEFPKCGIPGGSFRFDRQLRHSCWCCYDQIMVSEPLIEHVHGFEVLASLEGSLLALDGAGGASLVDGDHLPVTAELRTARWNIP